MSEPEITVEVVYAEPRRTVSRILHLAAGTTVAEALGQVRESEAFAGVDCSRVGVFGEACSGSRVLRHRDRLEIYRPLVTDAKTARRRRALSQPGKKPQSRPGN